MAEHIGNGGRRAELAANLTRVRERIRAACEAAGRADEPELIVVTKFHPASDVRLLAELGVTDVGENRDQEASAKAAELADLPLTWHFIGQLQTNKAKSVVRYADVIHSIDRSSLVGALGKAAAAAGLQDLACLVQVNLDPEAAPGRGGALPAEVPALSQLIDDTPGLKIAGVMAVAPLGADPAAAFRRLMAVSAGMRARFSAATMVSAGMSQDLEAAVAAGATHLRIGTDVLGARPAVG
ncbi:YggS family pyridoxal phosphate-dependent enzyme [Sinomonas sp. ASV486]|uniref:Pyridoxal phosphate homeostasis protein n=1 Tax=Sinomonas puerhi TaxID=3238584 RepID=A0AB39L958_9MICC|nr:YggS family pyridoxal phosphate-dependent enzyme [Sinomonas sp. ASV486]MDQ4489737.1 YggS family pyridoxal phosphate-dependent enzyme [Sinomonas sp. ASV486]